VYKEIRLTALIGPHSLPIEPITITTIYHHLLSTPTYILYRDRGECEYASRGAGRFFQFPATCAPLVAALFACGVNYPVPAPDTRHSNQALKRLKASKKAEGGLFFVCGDQELDL
jgi:hypothetical protein